MGFELKALLTEAIWTANSWGLLRIEDLGLYIAIIFNMRVYLSLFTKRELAKVFIAVCLFLPVLCQAQVKSCSSLFSHTGHRTELLSKIFGPGRLQGFERRKIEQKLFENSRAEFLRLWSQMVDRFEQQRQLSERDTIQLIDSFHYKLFDQNPGMEYSFATVLKLAKTIQRHMAPVMPNESDYVMFLGSFPNGKASLKSSDIDAWVSASLFRSYTDKVSELFSNADKEVRTFLGRTDKVMSPDFFDLNEGLPAKRFMTYNPIVILIYANRLEIGIYDSKDDRRLIIPINSEP